MSTPTETNVHSAIVTLAPRMPLEIRVVPTVPPGPGEVRVRVDWVASAPFDLHQSDGGLFVSGYPLVLGTSTAGEVVEVGAGVEGLAVGDQVFGCAWGSEREKAYQQFITVRTNLLAKLPLNISPPSGAAVADNFVTAWHILTTLEIPLPYPKPENYSPPDPSISVLVWGGSGSVGQYVIQVLHYYGYKNIVVTASRKHHEFLRSLGATDLVDYTSADVLEKLDAVQRTFVSRDRLGAFTYIIDTVGIQKGSVEPISKIARPPSVAAIVLPVIVRDASEIEAPEYMLDLSNAAGWAEGLVVKPVITLNYL